MDDGILAAAPGGKRLPLGIASSSMESASSSFRGGEWESELLSCFGGLSSSAGEGGSSTGSGCSFLDDDPRFLGLVFGAEEDDGSGGGWALFLFLLSLRLEEDGAELEATFSSLFELGFL